LVDKYKTKFIEIMKKEDIKHNNLFFEALSGTTGGALIGSAFGIVGGIAGGIIGGAVTGYSGYHSRSKKQSQRVKKGRVNATIKRKRI
jgi:uncharacterized membrane protein